MSNDLVGLKLTKVVKIEVEILQVLKPIPPENIEDFKEWLMATGIELGLGKHFEYYTYEVENETTTIVDVPCEFYVKTVNL